METQAIVQQLQHRIERIETSGRADDGHVISSGCAAIDQLLPGGGYRRGTLIEWVSTSSTSCILFCLSAVAVRIIFRC